MADVRKILETLQDVLDEPSKQFPPAFWEVLAKRCIQSIRLFKPLELAIVARAFDTHSVELKPRHNIYAQIAQQAQTLGHFPGLAIWVLADVLPRRLKPEQADLTGLLQRLGRQATEVMWELPPQQAVMILEVLTQAGVKDASLSTRVAKKVSAYLEVEGALDAKDLAAAASALAGQQHRDLQTLRGIAEAVTELFAREPSVAGAEAAARVLAAFQALDVDAENIPAELQQAASQASSPSASEELAF